MKRFAISYDVISTRVATVKADSIEQALENFYNDYNIVEDCEDYSYIKNIHKDNVVGLDN